MSLFEQNSSSFMLTDNSFLTVITPNTFILCIHHTFYNNSKLNKLPDDRCNSVKVEGWDFAFCMSSPEKKGKKGLSGSQNTKYGRYKIHRHMQSLRGGMIFKH